MSCYCVWYFNYYILKQNIGPEDVEWSNVAFSVFVYDKMIMHFRPKEM